MNDIATLRRWHSQDSISSLDATGDPTNTPPEIRSISVRPTISQWGRWNDQFPADAPRTDELHALEIIKELDLVLRAPPWLSRSHETVQDFSWLAVATNLESLELWLAEFDDEDAAVLQKLPRLKRLDLRYSNITSKALPLIAALEQLESLNLAGTKIDDEGLAQLARCLQLKGLNITGTVVSEAGISALIAAAPLEHLEASRTKIRDLARARLDFAKSLSVLNLSGNQLLPGSVAALKPLDQIRVLDLSGTTVGDEILQLVGGWAHLERLNLAGTRVTANAAVEMRRHGLIPPPEVKPSGNQTRQLDDRIFIRRK